MPVEQSGHVFGRANERVELDKQVSALYGAETAADLQFYLGMAQITLCLVVVKGHIK